MFANLEEDYSDKESNESDSSDKDTYDKDDKESDESDPSDKDTDDKDAPPKHLEAQVKIFTKCQMSKHAFLFSHSLCSIAGPPLNWERVCEPDQRVWQCC